jgi:hypothetical protein
MKILVLTAVVVLGLVVGLSQGYAESLAYRTPAHNYYQNNWMKG